MNGRSFSRRSEMTGVAVAAMTVAAGAGRPAASVTHRTGGALQTDADAIQAAGTTGDPAAVVMLARALR
ncbi:hypothetical protein [Streptomyces sp. NBC_00690]|uniref:hypothetical protein n=1 Tax=Streptomyces sp. NBC_00690 TaxID=2975808 RepID=UPI002E28B962|nr:hypothetical protein [Streptomyces sp. NBC_00690]